MLTGNGRGDVYEIFNPRWYRLDRWVWWAYQCVFNRKRPRMRITVHNADSEHQLRAIESDLKLPNVIAWPKNETTKKNQ